MATILRLGLAGSGLLSALSAYGALQSNHHSIAAAFAAASLISLFVAMRGARSLF